jgi:hypothetical protein
LCCEQGESHAYMKKEGVHVLNLGI